ncbi:peptide/nickel transport system ATP-binding protein [Arthrobacter sp. SLBN-100]|uniref:ATP-binding cassette domain-containing protein n=1 Tax=Arthrobacter sp. SLBN-100 TaxID=2768450 RepID=UPI00114DE57A|nr:ATP-binding cassette domain-containing protein [Arthrobacter sp. SLBN-100]TQJ69754.1 peptide/nickel transport system ATP-binding protein [Arthrobacter sp. SLBN-100]
MSSQLNTPAAAGTDLVLSVRNLTVDYAVHRTSFRAVEDVSFDVPRGSTVAIVGESGCGKSTIAKAIVRLLTPTSGEILVNGQDIARMPARQLRPLRAKVQMVFQDPYGSLDPHLTAEDIVAEPLTLRGIRSGKERRAEAAKLIDQVGLPASALGRRPAEFSGGQRQRIGIARALASKPELLVCDEATSALDVSVQAQVLELLADIQRDSGLTYLMISHNLGVVRESSSHVLVMSKGKIVEQGPTEQVLTRPQDPYTRALRAAALDPLTMTGRKPREVVSRLNKVALQGEPVLMEEAS